MTLTLRVCSCSDVTYKVSWPWVRVGSRAAKYRNKFLFLAVLFPPRLVSGVPGLGRIRHLSSSLSRMLHRARANPEHKKLWLSYPRTLRLHLCPTQGTGAQAVASFPWVASCAHSLWLTSLLFTEKQCFCRFQKRGFANHHKHCGLPQAHLQSMVFPNYFYSSSSEGENLHLNNVYCISCNSLEYQHVLAGFSWFCSSQHQTELAFQLCPPSRVIWNLTGISSALYLTKRVISY